MKHARTLAELVVGGALVKLVVGGVRLVYEYEKRHQSNLEIIRTMIATPETDAVLRKQQGFPRGSNGMGVASGVPPQRRNR